MMSTFAAFQRDYATASVLARGMWQALICTAGGIMIAIPANLALHFLNGRVRAIVRDMEWSGNEIMKYLNSEYKSGGAPKP
jgi:biopolymer transport protein ExbB